MIIFTKKERLKKYYGVGKISNNKDDCVIIVFLFNKIYFISFVSTSVGIILFSAIFWQITFKI